VKKWAFQKPRHETLEASSFLSHFELRFEVLSRGASFGFIFYFFMADIHLALKGSINAMRVKSS
jgi:hypothetical protein